MPQLIGTQPNQIPTNQLLGSGAFATIENYATLASPIFTGTPAAPTAAANTNTTQIATTAFVLGQANSIASTVAINGTQAAGTSSLYARADHVHPVDTSRSPVAGSGSITTVGTITSGTWNAGWITSSGQVSAAQGIKHGLNGHPVYETVVEYTTEAAGTWRKIVSAALQNMTYSTHGFCVEVVDPETNHAHQGSQNTVLIERYNVACVRTTDTVLDTPDACYVTGNGTRVRAVKVSTGNYEIQIQNSTAFREYRVRVYTYASNGAHTITYLSGADVGATGTAQYTASLSSGVTDRFQRVVAGSINGLALTANATGFQVAGGTTASRTLTVSNTLTLAGTDGTTMTFPSTSATVARTDAGQTFAGNQVITGTLTARGAISMTSSSIAGNPTLLSIQDQAGAVVVEWGRTDGTASTQALDFHTGATSTDFDSRIQATGGTGSIGGGTLELIAAQLTLNGNVSVSGTGRRITADFSNATIASRLAFQSSTTNGNTTLNAIPNGTGTAAQWTAFAGSDPNNAAFGALLATSTQIQVVSNKTGTGTTQSLAFVIGGSTRATFGASGGFDLATGLREARVAMDASDIDTRAGNYFTKTISGATTLTVSNVPAAGTAAAFVLELTNGGSATITWWSGMKWSGGTAPTLTASGLDILSFYTHDGGTTWRGMLVSKDSK